MNRFRKEFLRQVGMFREWADRFDLAGKYGEWECDYSEWVSVWDATIAYLDSERPELWNDEVAGELLYILARDNEVEHLKAELVRRPDCLLALALRGVDSEERDARWQVADALGNVEAPIDVVEPLLLQYFDDGDEYVCRRALLALGRRKSIHAEASALRAWKTGLEYQQMAALQVLSDVNSASFEGCRQIAARDERKYLAKAAVAYVSRDAEAGRLENL